MSTAARKSSQNRRTAIIAYLTSVADSTSDYNSKLRTSARSLTVVAAVSAARKVCQQTSTRHACHHSRAEQSRGQRPRLQRGMKPYCRGSRVGCKKSILRKRTRHAPHHSCRAEPRPTTAATTPPFQSFKLFSVSAFQPNLSSVQGSAVLL